MKRFKNVGKKVLCGIVLLTSLMVIPSFASQRVGNQLASSATSINYSDSFRGRTPKLIAMNGSQSSVFKMRSPYFLGKSKVKKVEAHVSLERGSSPLYLIVENDSGYRERVLVKKNGYYTLTGTLAGTEARGEWKVYIEGAGFSTSQATSTITVYFDVLN